MMIGGGDRGGDGMMMSIGGVMCMLISMMMRSSAQSLSS